MRKLTAAAIAILLCACSAEQRSRHDTTCHAGGYRLVDGRVFGLIPRGPGNLRYQFFTGETGGVEEGDDGLWRAMNGGALSIRLGGCEDPGVVFDANGVPVAGARIAYRVTETVFDGVDGRRAGRLVLPAEGPTKAIVVAVHGSERSSGRTGGRLQTLLPAFGIGVFAYDKRGTGASDGKYTQNFDILAGDAVRARREARRLFGDEIAIGYLGASQGGWVAPLAASLDGAAFVIAAYGLAISPSMEDEEEVVLALRAAGYGEDVIEKAREITAATRRVVRSDFKDGYKELSAVRKKYRDEPWYDEIEGEYSGDLLRAPNIGIRIVGPFRSGDGTPDYEPRPVIEALSAPQLWILAEDDRAAPSASTLEILRDIQSTNDRLDVVVFPDTDHGIYEFTQGPDGRRRYTRVAEGYYALIRDYIVSGDPTPSVEGPMLHRARGAGSSRVRVRPMTRVDAGEKKPERHDQFE